MGVCPIMIAKVSNEPKTGVTVGLVTADELERLLLPLLHFSFSRNAGIWKRAMSFVLKVSFT